ncbi:MAG: aminotransferase class V-fold PLP-dependent enzyme [[Clostridium] scindens]
MQRRSTPDIYVISDAVQHAPHAVIDVEDWGVDVANFAPYKFFGIRGCGYAYVSDCVAKLPHHKLIHKKRMYGISEPLRRQTMRQ